MPIDPNRRECPHCSRSLAQWSSRLTNCPFCRLNIGGAAQVAKAGEAPPSNYMARAAAAPAPIAGDTERWEPDPAVLSGLPIGGNLQQAAGHVRMRTAGEKLGAAIGEQVAARMLAAPSSSPAPAAAPAPSRARSAGPGCGCQHADRSMRRRAAQSALATTRQRMRAAADDTPVGAASPIMARLRAAQTVLQDALGGALVDCACSTSECKCDTARSLSAAEVRDGNAALLAAGSDFMLELGEVA